MNQTELPNIPPPVRCLVWAFLGFETQWKQIQFISKKDRAAMLKCEEILGEDKYLELNFEQKFPVGLKFAADLADRIKLIICKFETEQDQKILEKLLSSSEYTDKLSSTSNVNNINWICPHTEHELNELSECLSRCKNPDLKQVHFDIREKVWSRNWLQTLNGLFQFVKASKILLSVDKSLIKQIRPLNNSEGEIFCEKVTENCQFLGTVLFENSDMKLFRDFNKIKDLYLHCSSGILDLTSFFNLNRLSVDYSSRYFFKDQDFLVNKNQLKFFKYEQQNGSILLKDLINFQAKNVIAETQFWIGCIKIDSDLMSKFKKNFERIEEITKGDEKFQKFQITFEDQKMEVHACEIQFERESIDSDDSDDSDNS